MRIKQMVERPCFGSPTAFLIHSGDRYAKGRNGVPFPLRCNSANCLAAEACAHVAKRRLRSSPELHKAYDSFEEAGGVRELKRQRVEEHGGRATSAWGDLLRALDRHGTFACKNTDMLRAHIESRLADARQRDAENKRLARLAERNALIVAGSDDPSFFSELRLETSLRAVMFDCARTHPGAPPRIARCAANGAQLTAEVWRAKMIVEARGRKPTPGAVARQMVTDGFIEARRENAMRNGAVKSALERVHFLETVNWSGDGPVWERVTVAGLIEASEWLEPPATEHSPRSVSASADPLQTAA